MAGIENNILFGQGMKLQPSQAGDISRMQDTATDVSRINFTGNPEGSVSANPSSLCHDPVSGNVYFKQTGTGNTGWVQISGGDLHTAKFIVGDTSNGANYSTIAAALAAASSGDTIFLQPGTYTEDLSMKAGVNLTAFGSDGITPCQGSNLAVNVIIAGTCTFTEAGLYGFCGIQFRTNGAEAILVTGSNSIGITGFGITVYSLDGTGMSLNNSSCTLNWYCCTFRSTAGFQLFNETTSAGIDFENCVFQGNGDDCLMSVGRAVFNGCDMPEVSITTAGTGAVFINACYWQDGNGNLLTQAGTNTCEVYNSFVYGSASANPLITVGSGCTLNIANCELGSVATNVITGAGTINFGGLIFSSSSNLINVTTQNAFIQRPGILRNTKQPLFYAYIGSTDSNVTGNGANYKVGTNVAFTEVVDQNNNFNTNGTFTAPYDGNYYFNAAVLLGGVSVAMTNGYLFLTVTTGDDFLLAAINPGVTQSAALIITLAGSAIIPMTAGQTVTLNVQLQNGAGNDADILATGGAGVRATWFSGYMIG